MTSTFNQAIGRILAKYVVYRQCRIRDNLDGHLISSYRDFDVTLKKMTRPGGGAGMKALWRREQRTWPQAYQNVELMSDGAPKVNPSRLRREAPCGEVWNVTPWALFRRDGKLQYHSEVSVELMDERGNMNPRPPWPHSYSSRAHVPRTVVFGSAGRQGCPNLKPLKPMGAYLGLVDEI